VQSINHAGTRVFPTRVERELIALELKHFTDLDLAWVRHTGTLNRDELRSVFDRVHSATASKVWQKVFTDLADVKEVEVGFREIHWHAVRIQDLLRLQSARVTVSIHAPGTLSFGVSRIYQQVIDPDGPMQVYVSDAREEALAALNLPEIPAELV